MAVQQYKPRILWVSTELKMNLSFSFQSDVICTELAKRGYDIHYLAAGYEGRPYEHHGYKVYPVPMLNTKIPFGNPAVYEEYLRRLHPDLMISLTNTCKIDFLMENNKFSKKIPWIHWTPLESDTPLWGNFKYEKQVGYFVCVSQAAAKIVKPNSKNFAGVINHAVNERDFFPLSKPEKKALRKKYNIPEKAFVLGTVGGCTNRKQPLRLIDTFIKLAREKKDVYLVWCADFEYYKGNLKEYFNIKYFMKYFYQKYQDRIILIDSHQTFSPQKLNEVYNLFDVFVLATAGEGWGIPIVEAMFCQVPPMATDYSSIPEIITTGCGWRIKVKDLVWGLLGPIEVQGALVDDVDLLKKFKEAYAKKALRKKYGQQAYQKAKKLYTVQKIVDDWEKLLGRVFLESRKKYKKLWAQGQPNSRQPAESFLEITKWACFAFLKLQVWSNIITLTEGETKDTSLLNVRGFALSKMKKYQEAKACFEQILKQHPDNEKVKLSWQDMVNKLALENQPNNQAIK